MYKRQEQTLAALGVAKADVHKLQTMDYRAVIRAATAAKPVSYTHLRAHETVLDLVCRLLLEKNKHQKTQETVAHQQYTNI